VSYGCLNVKSNTGGRSRDVMCVPEFFLFVALNENTLSLWSVLPQEFWKSISIKPHSLASGSP
jgi:hypothetical protein